MLCNVGAFEEGLGLTVGGLVSCTEIALQEKPAIATVVVAPQLVRCSSGLHQQHEHNAVELQDAGVENGDQLITRGDFVLDQSEFVISRDERACRIRCARVNRIVNCGKVLINLRSRIVVC